MCYFIYLHLEVQYVQLSAWKVGDRGLKPRAGIQVLKKQNASNPLTRKDSVLWGASVTETDKARISNPVSGRQCHLIHLTIIRKFSWPSLACMCKRMV